MSFAKFSILCNPRRFLANLYYIQITFALRQSLEKEEKKKDGKTDEEEDKRENTKERAQKEEDKEGEGENTKEEGKEEESMDEEKEEEKRRKSQSASPLKNKTSQTVSTPRDGKIQIVFLLCNVVWNDLTARYKSEPILRS